MDPRSWPRTIPLLLGLVGCNAILGNEDGRLVSLPDSSPGSDAQGGSSGGEPDDAPPVPVDGTKDTVPPPVDGPEGMSDAGAPFGDAFSESWPADVVIEREPAPNCFVSFAGLLTCCFGPNVPPIDCANQSMAHYCAQCCSPPCPF
jgi:hypothetical protein